MMEIEILDQILEDYKNINNLAITNANICEVEFVRKKLEKKPNWKHVNSISKLRADCDAKKVQAYKIDPKAYKIEPIQKNSKILRYVSNIEKYIIKLKQELLQEGVHND